MVWASAGRLETGRLAAVKTAMDRRKGGDLWEFTMIEDRNPGWLCDLSVRTKDGSCNFPVVKRPLPAMTNDSKPGNRRTVGPPSLQTATPSRENPNNFQVILSEES